MTRFMRTQLQGFLANRRNIIRQSGRVTVAAVAFLLGVCFLEAPAAACRQVQDIAGIKLNPVGQVALARIGYDRAALFQAMRETSLPEALGCWATPTGNSDGQIVSAGLAQWNFGQGTLQPLLRSFATRIGSPEQFKMLIEQKMPRYGALIFSPNCVALRKISETCRTALLGAQREGRLNQELESELTWLFESDPMIQVQVDQFAGLLTSMVDDLVWVFPGVKPSPLQIKWAIDTKVQQGRFVDRNSLRKWYTQSRSYTSEQRAHIVHSILLWYEGECGTGTQEGVHYDCAYNLSVWPKATANLEKDRFDLLFMSFQRAHTATNQEGAYQADAFQRRATIVLGVGSVHSRRVPSMN